MLKSAIPFLNGTIITCLILIIIYYLYAKVLSKMTIKIEFDKWVNIWMIINIYFIF